MSCEQERDRLERAEMMLEIARESGTREQVAQARRRVREAELALADCLRGSSETVLEPLDPPTPPPDHRLGIAPPQAVSFDSNFFAPEIVLMARTEDGLSTSFWQDRTSHSSGGGWSYWMDHANTTGEPGTQWEREMPLVSWIDPSTGRFRVNGFFAFRSQDDKPMLGTPWWVLPIGVATDFRLDSQAPPVVSGVGRNFFPFTAATWYRGPMGDPQSVGRINVFGTVAISFGTTPPTGRRALREFWWDGNNWNWSDHPMPNANVVALSLGPGSFTFPENNGYRQAFLFALATDGGTPSDTSVQLYHWTRTDNWRWHDLGRPTMSSGCAAHWP
jgi:hypothetical protein